MEDYIIWNEPNVEAQPEKQLDAEHFAALLYHCWQKMTGAPRMYWGGVMFGPGPDPVNHPDEVDQNSLNYISGVYSALYDRGLGGGEYGGWPWTGINVHIHRDRSDGHINNLFNQLNAIRLEWGDAGDVLVGEWGVTVQDGPNKLSHIFNLLKPRASVMFLHSHHKVQEGTDEYWGLHDYSIVGDQYVLTTPTALHDPYDQLVGP